MRLPRVRFTVRTMMIAVLIAAAPLTLVARTERFRRVALGHEMQWRGIGISDLELYLLITAGQGEPNHLAEERCQAAGPLTHFMNYHAEMWEKYEAAARRPWLPVASDPPPPPRPSGEFVDSLYVRYYGVSLTALQNKYLVR